MRRDGQRSRDKYKIRKGNALESAYYSAGIPQRYWHETWDLIPTDLNLHNKGVGEPRVLSAQTQQTVLETLLKPEARKTSWRIGIGGEPTSEKAMALACRVAKQAVDAGAKVHFIDPGAPRWFHEAKENEEVVVIYNLSPESSTPERLMRVRDILVSVSDRLCLLVIDGNPDVYFNMLQFYKDALFYFTGPLVVTTTL